VASDVQGLAGSLSQNAQQLDAGISSTTAQINGIAAQIQSYNAERVTENAPDPGQDAQLYSALDNLSQLTNFSAVTQADGTVTVLLGGGSPLVIGQSQYAISATSSASGAAILDSQGNDITSQITSGQLGGMLDTRNRVLGSMIGDSQQTGTLNQFAAGLADTVNQILQTGTVTSGGAAGTALFTYDSSADAAATLAVNPAITPSQLAPVDSLGNANGNANQLAALENTPVANLGGMSLTQYFGQIASGIGAESQTATDNQTSQQQVVAQATSLVNQASGVSLDEEAVNVLQFQRAYQAAAQVLTVMNTLADSVLNLVQPY
jgi:flagellar hook-associated protein 1 FlgK